MKKLLNALALMLAIVTALTGCGGKLRYPAYYTLNLPAPPDPPAAENVRTSIAVREFQSPGYLRQGPIVYRSDAGGSRLLRIPPLGGRSAYPCDQRSHRPSARRRSVLHGLYVRRPSE